MSRPIISARTVVALVVVLLLRLALLFSTTFRDWPEMVVYPWLLHKGLRLYDDLLVMYPPLGIWMLKAVYDLMGFTLVSYRIVAYAILLATDTLLFFISLRWYRRLSVAVFITIQFILWSVLFEGNTLWFETVYLPFLLVGFHYLLIYVTSRRRKMLFLSSFFLGIALLVKQTVFWPLAVSVLTVGWAQRRRRVRGMKRLLLFLLVATWGYVFSGLYFVAKGNVVSFLYWSILFPLLTLSRNNYYVVAPSKSDLLYVAPVLLLGLISALWTRGGVINRRLSLISSIAILFSISLVAAALPRWGYFRMLPAALFASFASGGLIVLWKRARLAPLVVGLVLLMGLGRSAYQFFFVLERTAGSHFNANVRRIATIVDQTAGSSPFFVFGNYDFLYYLLDRPPAVRPWVQLQPWVVQAPGVQESIVASLDRLRVPYVFYFPFHRDRVFYADYIPTLLYCSIFRDYEYAIVQPLAPDGWVLVRKP